MAQYGVARMDRNLRRIVELVLLRQRNGTFGQAFEHQIVEIALFGENNCRFKAVALKTGAGADAKRIECHRSGLIERRIRIGLRVSRETLRER